MRKIRWRDLAPDGRAMHTALVTSPERGSWDLHAHDFHEVFWVDAGTCVHLQPDRTDHLQAGTLVFVRSRDVHGFRALAASEAFSMVNVAFSVAAWRELTKRYAMDTFWDESAEHPPTLRVGGAVARELRARFFAVIHAPPDVLHRDAFLLGLATHLSPPAEAPGFETLPSWLRTALHDYRSEPARLVEGPGELARRCGCSPAHLSRLLRERLGQTPSDYIRRQRLRHATRLLESSGASVTDIALDAGFGNLSHFHRCFREAHGVSPARYRKKTQRSIL